MPCHAMLCRAMPCHLQCQCFAGMLGMPQAPMPMKTPGCKARLCRQSHPGRCCQLSRRCSGTACSLAENSRGQLRLRRGGELFRSVNDTAAFGDLSKSLYTIHYVE